MATNNAPFGFGRAPIKAEGSAIPYDTNSGTLTTGYGNTPFPKATLKSHGKPVEIKPFLIEPTMEMLNDKSSPYNIAPDTLSNLWVVRFGKEWVDAVTVEDAGEEAEFWQHTANRLRELGYLEMHTLASSYRVVLRIVE